MFTLTVTLNEKANTVKIHGVGSSQTDGEKAVAGQISSAIQDLVNEDGLPVTFNSDIKGSEATRPTVSAPSDDEMPTLADLLAANDQ